MIAAYEWSLCLYSTASSSDIACPSVQARATLAYSAESIVTPIATTVALSVSVRSIVAAFLLIATSAISRTTSAAQSASETKKPLGHPEGLA